MTLWFHEFNFFWRVGNKIQDSIFKHVINNVRAFCYLNPYWYYLPCCHTWVELVLVLGNFVPMSSISGCLLVDARCRLRILKPQASLLLLLRLIVVITTCFFIEGHERPHHAHVALLGRPGRRLTVPAAHQSEAMSHRRGEPKIPTSAGHWMKPGDEACSTQVHIQAGVAWKAPPTPAGWRSAGVWQNPLAHLCDRSVRNTEAVWCYCCSSYSRLSQWLWKEVNSGRPEKPRSHISNAATWHLST